MVRVEAQHNLLVAQRVLLLDVSTLGNGTTLGGAQDALDFGAVDQTGEIGVGNQVGRQQEVLLELGGLGGGAVDVVEGLEGGGGPDDETAEVATGGELEEVEGVDIAGLAAGHVAEALDELLAINGGIVDDKRTAALGVTSASHLTLTSSELLGLLGLEHIGTSTNGGQDLEGSGSLGGSSTLEDGRVNDQGNLGDGGDLVTTGEQQRSDGRSSQSGGSSESPLRSSMLVIGQIFEVVSI